MFRVYVESKQINDAFDGGSRLEQSKYSPINSLLSSDHECQQQSGHRFKSHLSVGHRGNVSTGSERVKTPFPGYRTRDDQHRAGHSSTGSNHRDRTPTSANENKSVSLIPLRKRIVAANLRTTTQKKDLCGSSTKESTSYRKQVSMNRSVTGKARVERRAARFNCQESSFAVLSPQEIRGSRRPLAQEARVIPSYLDRTLSRIAQSRRSNQKRETGDLYVRLPSKPKGTMVDSRAPSKPLAGRSSFQSVSRSFSSLLRSRRKIKLKQPTSSM